MNSHLHFFPTLLVFMIAIPMPVWDYFESRRLKAHCSPGDRLRFYRTILAIHWLLAGVTLFVLGKDVLSAGGALPAARALIRQPVPFFSLAALSLLSIAVMLLPLITAIRKPKARISYTKLVDKTAFKYIFPQSSLDRRYFAVLSVSAGICEEIIFRSLLVWYFFSTPIGLNPFVALAVSSVLFGVNHVYQGASGIVKTGVVGFLHGLIYFVSGSLVLAMAVHAMVDLSALYMYRPDLLPASESHDDLLLAQAAT